MRNLVHWCVVTMWLCGAGWGAESNGTLHGVVMDSTGAVLANATIRIEHWDSGARLPILREDSIVASSQDGSYSVSLNPGIYDVFVSFGPFSPVAKKVKVEAGKSTEFSLKLELDPLTTLMPVSVH